MDYWYWFVVLPISAGIACTLSLGNKVLHKSIIKKYKKHKTQNQKDQQTIKSFDKLYKKSLQCNFIDKTEYESLDKFFKKYVDEMEIEIFFKNEHKNKIKFYGNIKLKINLQPGT